MFICNRFFFFTRVITVLSLLAGLFDVFPAQASTSSFSWARRIGESRADYGNAMALDDQGHTFIVGTQDVGSQNIFLSKLDANGDAVWMKEIGASSYEEGTSIFVDNKGSLFVTGMFSGTVDFDPGIGITELTSAGQADVFISKWKDNGDFIWARRIGGADFDSSHSLALDASGNVYTLGTFGGTVDFDPGSGIANLISTADQRDIFISKLDTNGNFVWAKSIGGSGNKYGNSIGIDAGGNIYTTGCFSSTVDFDPGPATYSLTANEYCASFISKLDSNGDFIWAKGISGSGANQGHDIAVGSNGNFYITGSFEGTVDFEPGAGTHTLASVGGRDVFISKFDTDGNMVWVKALGGSGLDDGFSITTDISGNVYTTGFFQAVADFDPGLEVFNLTSAGNEDIFISKLSTDGNFAWSAGIGSTASDVGSDLRVDPFGNIYLTGNFQSTVDFNPGSGTNILTSAGDFDVFIARFTLIPQIHYVKWDARGSNDGTSWRNAYVDLQSALEAASLGDEIWVALGIYKPTSGTDRAATFALKDGVAVYGGFASDEIWRVQRDSKTNLTVLSGDLMGNDDNSFAHDDPTRTDNVVHVVSSGGDSSITVLDGFTISGGNANVGAYGEHSTRGGGMWIGNGSPTLANLNFTHNSAIDAGGGIFITSGSPTLTDITFTRNSAEGGGGLVNHQSQSVLTRVTFTENRAAYMGGGAANVSGSQVTFTDVTFTSNDSNEFGGGMGNIDSDVTISNAAFDQNYALGEGGGIYNRNSHPTITNATFLDNIGSSRGGSGIGNENSNPVLTNITMLSRRGYDGIKNVSSHPVIRNSIIWAYLFPATTWELVSIADDPGSSSTVTDSVIRNGYPSGTNIITSDPLLGSFDEHGGSTKTLMLFAGSPAIASGNASYCPSADQRGVARPQGTGCDIGAFEFQPTSKIHYVKWNAAGANNGSSWANAYRDLQSALSVASNGDEIWVAAGTYRPTSTTDRSISFHLKNGVALYGGFAGTETSRTQRNYTTSLTVLSGDIGVPNNNTDNSSHVLVGSATNPSAILDGFTVSGGNAGNDFGGGMYVELGSPMITHVIFEDNYAMFGGGMFVTAEFFEPTITPILTDVIFRDNSAIEGGGMRNTRYSSPILTNVIFDSNAVIRTGGGLENFEYSSPILTNVTFINNTAGDLGIGGGMTNWMYSNPTLSNVKFVGNTADWAGGMANGDSSPSLTNVAFHNNSATGYGGGLFNEYNSSPMLTNVTFHNNSAAQGGAMSNRGTSSPTLIHVTMSGNTATVKGGAIFNSGNPIIRNSILWGNSGGELSNEGGVPVVTNSVIKGGYSGPGNINQNPLLGPLQDNGGFTQTMALGAGSPAIDAADNTNCPETDQRGVARPYGTACDIGAYEYDKSTTDVFIGAAKTGSYSLGSHESQRQSYAGVNNGPVKIINTDGTSILAAERIVYKVNDTPTSFSEMMGLPANQLDTTYWLPWYNNVDLDTQLRFANVSGAIATVHVYIGGIEMPGSPFTLAPGASVRKSFRGVNNGPVKIASSQKIVAAERVIYKAAGGANTSFSEMMALPNHQLDTTYWLPWYNNVDLDTQLRFANVTDSTATVHVYVAGQEMPGSPFTLLAGQSTRKSFPGVNNGPVKIVSNVNIVAAERVIYKVNGKPVSFSETMAMPNSQLDTIYWFPWYNNKDLDTQIRVANVSNQNATVHIYVGGQEMPGSPFTLASGASTRKSFVGVNDGPVKIVSNTPIAAAERVIYKVNNTPTSFSELIGLPNNLLDTTFWFPWYNNVDLDTQLRFGIP